jgi:4-amino-4-deoxy-L-arabinose transferase-like glycosyltransferase
MGGPPPAGTFTLNSPPVALNRTQLYWLAAVTALAAVLRFSELDQLSLSHMDEGSYVASAMTVATGGWYSFPYSQPLQSPPLFPWIIGGLVWLTQSAWPLFGVLVSAAFGTASIPLFFLLARRWGGNSFGLWAATLLAVSDFHVAYSRMALTDVPLTFWFLLTLYCVTRLGENVENPSAENHKPGKPPRQHGDKVSLSTWLPGIGWGIAAGLAAGAAWNTKYNGWLVLAIVFFATALSLALLSLATEPSARSRLLYKGARLIGCLLLAVVIAAACYAPWYIYVERHFPGGYAAVSANHRGYFSWPSAWPGHAYRLIASLAALRHWGWMVGLGLLIGMAWRLATPPGQPYAFNIRHLSTAVLPLLLVLGLFIVSLIQGSDAALLLLGAAGIVPALMARKRQRLLPAVWAGAFLVLTPLYHPYQRLMLPALPGFICLALWLIHDVLPGSFLEATARIAAKPVESRSRHRRSLTAGALAGAGSLALVWLLGPHPFGLLHPTQGVWNRWTSRESYRATGQAIVQHTNPEAIVICQSQLLMVSYCPRDPLVAETDSFAKRLKGIPENRDCYLVVDHFWIHQEAGARARQGLRDHARELTPVAIIPNDLNIVTLLDQISQPKQIAEKLAGSLPVYTLPKTEPALPGPPPLSAPFQDVIVLYRVKVPPSP